jgi:endoglucanase
MNKLTAQIFLVLSLGLGGHVLAANPKLDFWKQQRRGANCFNKAITTNYFQAARAAGIEFLRLAPDKWMPQQRDFLIGNADQFETLVAEDLQQLKLTLDDAHAAGVKVVLTMISLPGARWRQLNGGKNDDRLWRDPKFMAQAEKFWTQLAGELKEHPAIVGYNPLNEPHPERGDGVSDFWTQDIVKWYERRRGSTFDPNEFNRRMVVAIRRVDTNTPIILDAAIYAAAPAFTILAPVDGAGVLYSVHMYEPYEFTNLKQNAGRFKYPGAVEVGEAKQRIEWNIAELEKFLQPVADWAQRHRVPANRILVGEFGCNRTIPGAKEYLGDLLTIFEKQRWHWAFYGFREDEWDGMDYECGTGKLGWEYWKAVEAGQRLEFPRKPNPLWDVLQSRLRPQKMSGN